MPAKTRLYVAFTIAAALAATAVASRQGTGTWLPFWLLLLAVLASSGFKVQMANAEGTMSLNFPFILLGIVQLSPLQAILLAALSVAAQCRIRVLKIFTALQIVFNVANAMLATACACAAYAALSHAHMSKAPSLALASLAYFFSNTVSVALVLASSKRESAVKLWRGEYPWYLPFYLLGAVLAALVNWMSGRFGWSTALLLIPSVYILYRAYMGQIHRLQERQQYLEETEALHLRTIEGLAMAIEAKDQNTHDHLFRVRHYVKAVGNALHLDGLEMKALETAAFLHDIGKLAVPEHIINKPGKLTPEEFEKMKIHPVVGADILERVCFPYPVVPIVRSHHEWWNGTGYPDGLRATDIPIGARILTVIDCFDALVSDRPYRKGMPAEKALELIRSLSGKQFDPTVVAAFDACYEQAEKEAGTLIPVGFVPLNTEVDVWRGAAPGAGFEAGSQGAPSQTVALAAAGEQGDRSSSTLGQAAAAHQIAQGIFELSQNTSLALTREEAVALLSSRLSRLIRFDALGLYRKRGDTLERVAAHSTLAITFGDAVLNVGDGLSGWVAQESKPLLNGNASVEPGSPLLADGSPALRSGLSIPLYGSQHECFAVLTIYSATADAFTRDDLNTLLAMESRLSLAVKTFVHLPSSLTMEDTDFLTGLPNARRLLLQLEAELATAADSRRPLCLIACDLDRFAEVNQRRGHLAGNALLKAVAEEFRSLLPLSATVGRLGGDEFILLLPNTSSTAAQALAAALAERLNVVAERSGLGVTLQASTGLALAPEDGTSADDLLAVASRRMFHQKQSRSRTAQNHSAYAEPLLPSGRGA